MQSTARAATIFVSAFTGVAGEATEAPHMTKIFKEVPDVADAQPSAMLTNSAKGAFDSV